MTIRWTSIVSIGLLLTGLALAGQDKPHKKEWYEARRTAEKAAEQGEYLAAAKGLEAYSAKWGPEPVAAREVAEANKGAKRYRGLANRWILAKRKPAEHLKAFLRDLLAKPEGHDFGSSPAERARAFAFALQHDAWLQGQAAKAFPAGVKVQSPGRKATPADEQALLDELAGISLAQKIPLLAGGDRWKLTLNLEVESLGSTLPGARMKSIRATGNCKLQDSAGELVTTFTARGTGIHLDQAKAGVQASRKMAHDLLDKLVTYFLTKLSYQPG